MTYCIDVMGLNDNYLICVFMNININVENGGKNEGKTSHYKILDESQDLSCMIPEANSNGCQCGQRDHLNAIKYCPQK